VIFGARTLARRRLALVERSQAQRRALAAAVAPLLAPAALADRVVSGIRDAWPWVGRALTVYALLKRLPGTRRNAAISIARPPR
jgi:hypothetical protein